MAQAVAAVGIGSTIGGGIASALGAEATGQAQSAMYNYQSALSTLKSSIDKQNADYASQQGEQQAQQYGMGAAQTKGQIKASQASTGLDINSGSAKAVQESESKVTSLDLDQIRSNSAKTAYDFDVQSVYDKAQAGIYTAAAADASAAASINVESSILGTAGSVSSKWLQGQQVGLWGGPAASSGFAYGGS